MEHPDEPCAELTRLPTMTFAEPAAMSEERERRVRLEGGTASDAQAPCPVGAISPTRLGEVENSRCSRALRLVPEPCATARARSRCRDDDAVELHGDAVSIEAFVVEDDNGG